MNRTIYEGVMDGLVIDQVIRDEEFQMVTKHFHNEYEIYYLCEGSRYYFIDQQTYHIHKGTLVLIDSQQIHKTEATDSLYHNRVLIEFNQEPFGEFFKKLSSYSISDFFKKHHGIIVLDEKGQKQVESLLSCMMKEIRNQQPHYDTLVHMKLSELLFFILRSADRNEEALQPKLSDTPKHKIVHEVAQYISTHYSEVISLENIAEHFYINKSYLSRIFKEVTGYTVNEFINIKRIKSAQKLLINTNDSIQEIASQIGYESHTYFERVFKKHLETSPLKYRKKSQLPKEKKRDRLGQ